MPKIGDPKSVLIAEPNLLIPGKNPIGTVVKNTYGIGKNLAYYTYATPSGLRSVGTPAPDAADSPVFDGDAMTLNGTSQYIQLPSPVSNTGITTEATMMLRLKLDNATPATASLTGFVDLHGQVAVDFRASHYPFTDGKAYINTLKSTRVNDITLSGSVTRTDWHWVCITSSPGTGNWKFYQNKTLVTTGTGDSTIDLTKGVNRVGYTYWKVGQPEYFMDGQISDFILLNKALSLSELSSVQDDKWQLVMAP